MPLKEKFVIIPSSPRNSTLTYHAGTHGEAPELRGRSKNKGKHIGPESLLCFLWERQSRAGKLLRTGLNYVGRLWAIGLVSSSLVPSPELLGQEKYWLGI